MSFSSGTFSLVAGNPVVTGTTISSTTNNNTLSDIATGLTTCVLKDGTQATTASVPFVFGIAVTTSITTPSTTFAVANTTATTVNAFGAATALNFGGNTTTWTPTSGTTFTHVTATATTLNLFNTVATTINFAGGASTALNVGHASGTNTILGATSFSQAATFSAGAVIAASQALTGTVANSTISGFLSVAATTGTFTNVGGTLSTATQNNVTTMTGLTTVGALNVGSITSGFGAIDVGADAITTTGTLTGGGTSFSANNITLTATGEIAPGSGNIGQFRTSSASPSSTVTGVRISDLTVIASIWSGGTTTTAQTHINFINGNGTVGSISTNGTATAFNTASDKRVKTIFNLATDMSALKSLEVWDGEWNVDQRKDRFLIAQDAYLIKPSAVTVGDDTVDAIYEDYFEDVEEKYTENVVELFTDETGKQWQHITPLQKTRKIQVKKQRFVRWTKRLMNPWSIDYSKFVPELIAGWQDHERRLTRLESMQH